MRIVHICLTSHYTKGLTYQDNQLAEQSARDGHRVLVVSDVWRFIDGKLVEGKAEDTILSSSIRLVRLPYVNLGNKFLSNKIRAVKGLYELLAEFKPDVIFVHNCQFVGIIEVVKYAKDCVNVKVVVDSHADFSNSAHNWLSREVLHRIVYKWCAKQILPYATKFYGVLPARCDFLHDMYGIPKKKIDFLPMGANDKLVKKYTSIEIQQKLRLEFGFRPDDFVIVTGGKIDMAKMQVLQLMRGVNSISDNVKLLIFGSVDKDLQQEFDSLCSDKIRYMGWTDAEGSYKYLSMADIVCFPGRHSVYWEQAVAQEKPLIVKWWQGTTHVDYQGNVKFLYKDTVEEINQVLQDVMKPEVLREMQKAAKIAASNFLYGEIAMKVLRDVGLL